MRNYFTNKRIIYIIGMLEDASGDEIPETISGDADVIITTSLPGNSDYRSPLKLAEQVWRYSQNVTASDSPEEAMEIAGLLTEKDGILVILGPLPLLGRMDRIAEDKNRIRDTHGIAQID